jgi:16S rRNA G966 N2-methylase RsmD
MGGEGLNFPLSTITPDDRDKEFQKLQKLKFNDKDELSLSYAGNKASNFYFQLFRSKTKIGKWSHWDAWNDPDKRKKIINADKSLHKKNPKCIGTPTCLRSAMRMSLGSVNQFKPYVAVFVYQKFKPNRILDFTAGWGDRLVAAMSQNIDYIGIDTNKSLKGPYTRMIKEFSKRSTSKVKMIFKKAQDVDYTKLEPYDLIFTSPPYFSLEQYRGMEKFDNDKDFVTSFFIPTINKSWNSLKKGGVLALNMPEDMYDFLVPILGKGNKIKMPIANRFAYKSKKKRFEYIWWWRK